MSENIPAIPEVPLGEKHKDVFDAMKEAVEVWTGERRSTARQYNAVVTYQDLLDMGLITEEQIPK